MPKQNSTFICVFLVYLLLFVSGAERFNVAVERNIVLAFLVALAAWYLYTDRKISDSYLLYMTIFVGLLFSLSLYTGGSLSLLSVIAATMEFVIAYLILKTVGVKFTETYIKVVVFLAAISVLGYLIDIFNLFDGLITKLPRIGSQGFDMRGYEGIFYIFKHRFHPERNNSIFFEPGSYQGFLNAALFLIVFTKTGMEIKTKWIYIAVLIVALITAGSTTGFVIFSVLFCLFLYKSKMASFFQKAISAGLLIAVTGVFAVQFQSIVVEKLDNYLNPTEARKGWSAENRSYDAQTDFQVFKQHVFGLGYEKYKEEFRRIGGFAASTREGSSNGVTGLFAKYGIIYAVFIFTSYFLALKYLLGDYLLTMAAFVMFVMFLWAEAYYQVAPISFSIIAAAFVFNKSSLRQKAQNEDGVPQTE